MYFGGLHGGALFESTPHLNIALGGPDSGVVESLRLVIRTTHVERHAVLEDHPTPVFGTQRLQSLVIDLLQRRSFSDAGPGNAEQIGGEGRSVRNPLLD